MPYYYGYLDPTYILVLIGAVLCILASIYVNSAMKQYARIRNARGLTGAQTAERILTDAGIRDVRVECLRGDSGDHYDPRNKTLKLSYQNYNGATITSVAVAAHECGHAIQHQKGYSPMKFRSMIVPAANLGSRLGFPLIILGVILSWNQVLISIGIWAFSLAVLFQLVTLPVEFNASGRAIKIIEGSGLLGDQEIRGAKKVLTAAAMTYVAAAASSVLQLLRLVLLFGGNRRRD